MDTRGWAIATIAVYGLMMLCIGIWANRRTRDAADFFLSGRRLGPWIAALAQGATQSSAWTLAGVSGAAFAWGLDAAWIWASVVAGYAVNWLWIAPRLRVNTVGNERQYVRTSLSSRSKTSIMEAPGRDG